MADTWTAMAAGAAPAQNKYMLGLFNGAGSGRIFRVYRVYIIGVQSAAITGVNLTFQLRLTTATTIGTGTTITPVAHDTNNTALPAQLLVSTATQTVTDSSIFRVWQWSSDEAAIDTASQDEVQLLMPYCLYWEAGAYDSVNIQPIVLREGQGLTIKQTVNSTVGAADYVFEFTNAAT